MLDLIFATALVQAASSAPDPCNAAGRAAQPLPGCPTWVSVRNNPTADGYYDPASVRRDGDRVDVTVRLLLPAAVENAHSLVIRYRLGCEARTVQQLHYATFDAAGRVLSQETVTESNTQQAEPDSAYAALVDLACTR